MSASAIVFSGIAPHPPIMVPEVGLDAITEVQTSIAAMAEFSSRLIASGAETVVLISPHAPLEAAAFVAYQAPTLHGDFANFRSPETTVAAPLDEELLRAIRSEAEAARYEIHDSRSQQLDHGTAVPLYFLKRHGWHGRLIALGYSYLPDEDHLHFGACIGQAVNRLGRPVAVVASGDLSHRLKPDAPAGYQPTAHLFDEEVVAALNCNAPVRIINIDQDLRRRAGECGYRSMLVALGATEGLPLSCEVLNYEAPFGVGYLVAQIANQAATRLKSRSHGIEDRAGAGEEGPALTRLARQTVETFVLTGSPPALVGEPSGLLGERAACFVSIRTWDSQLRGCIGTIEPCQETLREEIVANALRAATSDPRFKPVVASELEGLHYSVDILSVPEPAEFAQLDPEIYGVIVEDEQGEKRGLLLPDIEGIDSPEKQVQIASRKAGIKPGAPVKFWRFRVERFREE